VWLGGDECSKPDQAEDRRGVYRNCGWERISVCGVKAVFWLGAFFGADLWSRLEGMRGWM